MSGEKSCLEYQIFAENGGFFAFKQRQTQWTVVYTVIENLKQYVKSAMDFSLTARVFLQLGNFDF